MFEIVANSSSTQPSAAQGAAISFPENLGRNSLLKRDQALFWEGDAIAGYYRVISGAIRLCKQLSDGRRQVSDFFAAGDVILIEFAEHHGFTAEAIVDSVVCRYARASIDGLLQSDPHLANQLLTHTCQRLAAAHSQMVVLGRKTAEERIATFLSVQASRLPNRGRVMNLPMSRTDIGDYLGMTIETVSRTLSKLRRDGVIDLPDLHSVRIIDWETLDLLCDGDA